MGRARVPHPFGSPCFEKTTLRKRVPIRANLELTSPEGAASSFRAASRRPWSLMMFERAHHGTGANGFDLHRHAPLMTSNNSHQPGFMSSSSPRTRGRSARTSNEARAVRRIVSGRRRSRARCQSWIARRHSSLKTGRLPATRSTMPARTRLRTAVRRRSWEMLANTAVADP